jgi:phosphohistidine phosphatase
VELYLIRHGIAVERGVDIPDEERSLTNEGRKKTEKVAKKLRNLGIKFDLISTSPLVRARQTAKILHSYELTSQLEESPHLALEGDIYAWINDGLTSKLLAANSTLALVGHQPNLGQWAEILLWGEAKEVLVLKKAGIIGLTLPEGGSPIGKSQMFWLTPPKFFL